MEATPRRPLGPARIVALVVIALAVAALAYLRFAPDAGRVSVPSGAHAGELTMKPCTYGTERGSYPADCGTLVVREIYITYRTHLVALLTEQVGEQRAPYLAGVLLAALDPDLVMYQRQALGLSTDELERGWAQLIESVCGAAA